MFKSIQKNFRKRWDKNVIKWERIGLSGQNFDVIKVTYNGLSKRKYVNLARFVILKIFKLIIYIY